MTKYQRGDPILGWNDCPVMLNTSNNSSSTSLKSKKKFQRVGLNFEGSTTPQPGLNRIPSSTTNSFASAPPSRSISISSQSSMVATSPNTSDQVGNNSVTVESTIDLLEDVFHIGSTLPEREFNHHKTKLSSQIRTASLLHLRFLHEILHEITEVQNTGDKLSRLDSIKQEVVEYMMANDGVSGWCTSLKKVISSF